MNLFNWLSTQFFPSTHSVDTQSRHQVPSNIDINPASGLPMVDGIGSIDVAGNTYGFNSSIKEDDMYEFGSDSSNDSNYEVDLSCDDSYSSSTFD